MAIDPILTALYGTQDVPAPQEGDAEDPVAAEPTPEEQAAGRLEEADTMGRVMAHAYNQEHQELERREAQGLPAGPGPAKGFKATKRPRLQVEDGRLIRAPKGKVVVDIEMPVPQPGARRLGGIQHWILEDDGKTPKLLDATDPNVAITWAVWFENADRRMKITRLPPDVKVSTVFLGIDHGFHGEIPLLFETMCFSGLFEDEHRSLAATYEQAIAQHDATVALMHRVIQRHKIKKFFGKFLFWRRWTRG